MEETKLIDILDTISRKGCNIEEIVIGCYNNYESFKSKDRRDAWLEELEENIVLLTDAISELKKLY